MDWGCGLGLWTGAVDWGCVDWGCGLGLWTRAVDWGCGLGLCGLGLWTGAVDWGCGLGLWTGAVDMMCVACGVFARVVCNQALQMLFTYPTGNTPLKGSH